MAEAYTEGYHALDMTVDQSVQDSFANPYFSGIQQDSATYTGSWYFTRTRGGVHQVDINTGANITSVDFKVPGVSLSLIDFSVPVYVRYNYNVALRHNLFLYGGVLGGFTASSGSVDLNIQGLIRERSTSTLILGIGGVGVGLKYLGRQWGIEIGYDVRYSGENAGGFDAAGHLRYSANYRLEQLVTLRGVVHF